jgi:hypothetical protein
MGGGGVTPPKPSSPLLYLQQSQQKLKPVLVKRDLGVYIIYLSREICKPVLKPDFSAHGLMESLSEFGPWHLDSYLRRCEQISLHVGYLLHALPSTTKHYLIPTQLQLHKHPP